jgi:hypothetical protein
LQQEFIEEEDNGAIAENVCENSNIHENSTQSLA